MAHTLTETSGFDANVTVPDPGDARTAASVNVAFQALANRTRSLLDENADRIDEIQDVSDDVLRVSQSAAINWSHSYITGTSRLSPRGYSLGKRQIVSAGDYALLAYGNPSGSGSPGKNCAFSLDGYGWFGGGSAGFPTAGGTIHDLTGGLIGSTGYVIAINDTEAGVRKSTNFGGTFTAAGTASTGLSVLGYRPTSNGRFIAAGVGKIYTSDNVSGWSSRTVPAGWTAKTPYKIEANPETGAVLIMPRYIGTGETPSTVIHSAGGGTTWAESSTIPMGTSGQRTLMGMAYSVPRDRWVMTSHEGDVWTSDNDGSTWTQRVDKNSGDSVTLGPVAAIGTSYVACGSSGLQWSGNGGISWGYLAEVDYSEAADPGSVVEVPTIGGGWEDITAHQGRLVVARTFVLDSDPTNLRLAYRLSMRLPPKITV